MTIRVEGVDTAIYTLQKNEVQFTRPGRQDVLLHFRDDLPDGLYRFRVIVSADSGWTKEFQSVHFVRNENRHS